MNQFYSISLFLKRFQMSVTSYCSRSISISLHHCMDCDIGIENEWRKLYISCNWSHYKAFIFCTLHCSIGWREWKWFFAAFPKCFRYYDNDFIDDSFRLEYYQDWSLQVSTFPKIVNIQKSFFFLRKKIKE